MERKEAERAAAHAAGKLTEDDRVAVLRAPDRALQELVDDPAVPDFVRSAVVAEQARRKEGAKIQAARLLMQSPEKQFKITGGPAGMRYVTKTAYSTTLQLGCVVSPVSYDLVHVAEQGFTWEEIEGIEITRDQLGFQISTAK
jgi:hypothetical protein